MELNKYIAVLEGRDAHLATHERFLESFMHLKDYTTSLRLAVANIPEPVKPTKKNKESAKLARSIKKAKQLANKEPPVSFLQKKRKTEEAIPRVKRSYKKRKALSTTSNSIPKDEATSSDSSSSVSSSSSASDEESSQSAEEEDEEKSKVVVTEKFI